MIPLYNSHSMRCVLEFLGVYNCAELCALEVVCKDWNRVFNCKEVVDDSWRVLLVKEWGHSVYTGNEDSTLSPKEVYSQRRRNELEIERFDSLLLELGVQLDKTDERVQLEQSRTSIDIRYNKSLLRLDTLACRITDSIPNSGDGDVVYSFLCTCERDKGRGRAEYDDLFLLEEMTKGFYETSTESIGASVLLELVHFLFDESSNSEYTRKCQIMRIMYNLFPPLPSEWDCSAAVESAVVCLQMLDNKKLDFDSEAMLAPLRLLHCLLVEARALDLSAVGSELIIILHDRFMGEEKAIERVDNEFLKAFFLVIEYHWVSLQRVGGIYGLGVVSIWRAKIGDILIHFLNSLELEECAHSGKSGKEFQRIVHAVCQMLCFVACFNRKTALGALLKLRRGVSLRVYRLIKIHMQTSGTYSLPFILSLKCMCYL